MVRIYIEHPCSLCPLWLFLNKQFILSSFKFKINISNKIALHFSSLCIDMHWKRIQMSLNCKDEIVIETVLGTGFRDNETFPSSSRF